MDEFPELTFGFSQPALYEVVRTEDPKLFARLLKMIAAGRWEPTTLQWVEGDVNMASGEAQARQILQAARYTREVLGYTPDVFHAPDTYGGPANLPQIAVSGGAKYYYHFRANPGGHEQWPAYWWEGKDGSRLLAFSTPIYTGEILASDLAFAAIRAHQAGLPVGLHFHGIGDHGGGPSRQNLQALRRFQQLPLLPNAQCSTERGYAAAVIASGRPLPVFRGETSPIFEGAYTSHGDAKLRNRTGENLLMTADTLCALAGVDQCSSMREAWRKVLFNQFHDIFAGSAIHRSYEKNESDFDEAVSLANGAIDAALNVLHPDAPSGEIYVTNPLGVDRADWVIARHLKGTGGASLVSDRGDIIRGEYGSEGLGFVAHVPALSTVSFTIRKQTQVVESAKLKLSVVSAFGPGDRRRGNPLAAGDVQPPYLEIQTPVFHVFLRKDCGVLTSFIDKRVSRELVRFGMRRAGEGMDTARPDHGLNVFQLIDELPHPMSAWQMHEVNREESLLRDATTTVLESGTERVVIEVTHKFRSSVIRQLITFYADLVRVDFDTTIDWQEVGDKAKGVPGLKISFNSGLSRAQAWYETPFSADERPADGQEYCALRWAEITDGEYGVALLNDGKHGHDALGSRLRLTLIRSSYDPDATSAVGVQRIRFALFPHPGNWRDAGVVAEAAGFNQRLLVRGAPSRLEGQNRRFNVKTSGDQNVVVVGLKHAEDGSGIVVRIQETHGRGGRITLSGLPTGASAVLATLLEEAIRQLPVVDRTIEMTLEPWQVRTVIVKTRTA